MGEAEVEQGQVEMDVRRSRNMELEGLVTAYTHGGRDRIQVTSLVSERPQELLAKTRWPRERDIV